MITWMAEALVPEHSFSRSFDGIDRCNCINPFAGRKVVEKSHVENTVFSLDEGALMMGILESISFPLVGKELNGAIDVRGKLFIML